MWIPEAVGAEFGTISLPCVSIRHTQSNFALFLKSELNLGPGEAEAISLASERKTRLLIDDRKGRRVSESMGLQVTGTLGFLLEARKSNLIESAFEKVKDLRKVGFFVSDDLLEQVLELERHFNR